MTFLIYKIEGYLLNLIKEIKPKTRSHRLKRSIITGVIALFLLASIFTFTFSGIGIISHVEARDISLSSFDTSSLPAPIVQSAQELAYELHGRGGEADFYFKQLTIAYSETIDKDFVIFFNPGGWGTKKLQDSPEWLSIIEGIQTDIESSGYKVITLNYQRTYNTIRGKLNELKEMCMGYPSKASDLVQFVNFLTIHNPELTVILAGESTGTIICDRTMNQLYDNDRIYSIQTGSPPWHQNYFSLRTVLINDNGNVPDTFSQGDIFTILKTSIKSLLGFNEQDDEGDILSVFSAPGHEYWWQDKGVCSEIENFLEKYFGLQTQLQSVE